MMPEDNLDNLENDDTMQSDTFEDDVIDEQVEATEAEQLDESLDSIVVSDDEIEGEDESDPLEATETESSESGYKRLSLSARISALLFVSTKPLSSSQLSTHVKASIERVEEALLEISTMYSEEVNGFALVEIAGGWQLRTSPHVATTIHRLIPPRARRLSRAAAESLAVVAYKQPVQRAEIEAIRGVDALPTIKTLLDAKLIRIVGRDAAAGNPALYGTTQTFLEKFGMRDLSELPTPRELFELSQEPGEASESLEADESNSGDVEEQAAAVDEETTKLSSEIEVDIDVKEAESANCDGAAEDVKVEATQ
jgi:segregation and condensation protein B